MKKYKLLSTVLIAAAVCGLCAIGVSAEEVDVDEQINQPLITESIATENVVETVAAEVTTVLSENVITNSTVETTKIVTTKVSDDKSGNFGWKEESDGKKYYISENGEKLTGYQEIDGKEYYFSANGALKSGFYTVNNVRMFFSPETYERQLGWMNFNNTWYYFDEAGKYTGRKTIDNKDYIFDTNGACFSDWFEYEGSKYYSDHENGLYKNECTIDGEKYYFSSKGRFKSGWLTSNGKRIFYDYDTAKPVYGWVKYNGFIYYSGEADGKYVGEKVIDGIKYKFEDNGCQLLGLVKLSDGNRYYDETGEAKSGFLNIEGKKYYFSESTYLMQTGLQSISGKKYYFGSNGEMQTGWQNISSKKYYFDKNGVMQTGWQKISGKKHYFDKNGEMQTGLQNIDGKKYYFNKNGEIQTGWQKISGSKYYFNKNGEMQTGWQTIDDKKYYFGNDGVMRTGKQTIDGKDYYFDKDGALDSGRWSTVNGNKYYYDSEGKMYKNGVYKIKNGYYCFSSDGIMQTGWQKIGNDYYLFDRGDGKRQFDKTVDGVKINKDGKAYIDDWSKSKIETMMTAHNIMTSQTNASDSMEEKRLKCFNWIMSFPYHRFRFLSPIYTQAGWEMTFANDMFKEHRGCCVSEAAALAFLFREIGYTDVAIAHDSSHAWTTVGQYLFDPLFAESKSFEMNYNVLPSDYRVNPLDKRRID